jgi:hypothetical protein
MVVDTNSVSSKLLADWVGSAFLSGESEVGSESFHSVDEVSLNSSSIGDDGIFDASVESSDASLNFRSTGSEISFDVSVKFGNIGGEISFSFGSISFEVVKPSEVLELVKLHNLDILHVEVLKV